MLINVSTVQCVKTNNNHFAILAEIFLGMLFVTMLSLNK